MRLMESENSKMRRNFFENYEELSEYMVDKAQDGLYTVAVLFYDDALGLLRELMRYDDLEVEALDIEPEEYCGYAKEYYVSLADDMVVSVEPAYVSGRYLDTEADITLIDGGANSAIIKNLPENKCHEIYIGITEEEMEDDDFKLNCDDEDTTLDDIFENAELIKGKNDNVIGIRIGAESLFRYLFG